MTYYAVKVGKVPGVYETWAECNAQVKGFPKCQFKKFRSRDEALQFVAGSVTSGVGVTPKLKSALGLAGGSRETNLSENGFLAHKRPLPFQSFPLSKKMHTLSGSLALGTAPRRQCCTSTLTAPLIPEVPVPTQHDPSRICEVWTDGCCLNNGQDGAVAGIGVFWGRLSPHNISEHLPGRATNNRAEILAAVRAIGQAKDLGMTKIIVNTDSQFLISSMTSWIFKWQENNWRGGNGPVVNREEFETLLKAVEGIEVEWNHVRGHQGIFGNEVADRLANEGALKSTLGQE